MDYLLVVSVLALGVLLVATGLFAAVVYTPFGYSFRDTAMTAVTGACLQVGNLLVVASVTAIIFDVLAAAGVRYDLLIPTALGYATFHLVLFRSSISVTRLQGTPFDPGAALSRESLKRAAPGVLRAISGRGKGS